MIEDYLKVHSPGYVICTNNNECVYGNLSRDSDVKVNNDTLYDIASLTKLFTSILVYMAYDERLIDLNQSIYSLDNNFINLKNITVKDLLSHNTELWTNGYLGNAQSKNEFYKILYSSSIKSNIPTYVDSHYIILGIILEKIYKKTYKDLVIGKIAKKLELNDLTFDPSTNNIASCDYEDRNSNIIRTSTREVHDTKARNLKKLGIYTAHAGIFITGRDLIKFLKSYIYEDTRLVKKETIDLMLMHDDRNKYNYDLLAKYSNNNNINFMYNDSKNKDIKLVKTYNYMGTRYKNDIDKFNEIPNNVSKNTFVFSGYTGPAILVDIDKKIIICVLCNVVNRCTLDRETRKNITFKIIKEEYEKSIN